ncbi:MAG TPA: c-type cytochrome [Novosphingobium sp.]|nr:c-type cytochrome [Novosphingobium sp.]
MVRNIAGFIGPALALGALALAAPLLAAGDAERGKALFARCAACHSVEPGKNKLGPSLAGTVGRKAGAVPGYKYSPAMTKSGKVWDAKALDAYLAAPTKAVPGTTMVIAVPNAEDRAHLIAYLATVK